MTDSTAALAHRVAELAAEVDALRAELADATATLTRFTDRPQAWVWADLDNDGADARMAELEAWYRSELVERHKWSDTIPWADNPATLDLLTAIYVAWQEAYRSEGAPGTAALDWQTGLPALRDLLERKAGSRSTRAERTPRSLTA